MPLFYVKMEIVREFAVLADSPKLIAGSEVMDRERAFYGDDICLIAISDEPMDERGIKFAKFSRLDIFDLDGNAIHIK